MVSLPSKQTVLKTLAVLAVAAFTTLPVQAGDSKGDVSEIGNRKLAHKSIISQEREIAAGRQYAAEINRTAKFITDPVINEYVNRVAQNVARNSDWRVPLRVKVIEGPEITAFALRGGFLYVYSGLLRAASEEDQLAGVMPHKTPPAAARHWASQMTRASILQYATIPLIFVPMTYPVYLGVSQALNIGVPVAFLKFDRSAEAEADYLGLQYMYKAGYDPNAYVAFFGKVLEEERRQPGSIPKIFQDHPPTPDRILKAEEEIKQLPKRDEYLVSTSEFDDVKSRLDTVVAALKKKDREGVPTLEKRNPDGSAQPTTKGQDQGDEKPPVLKRRD